MVRKRATLVLAVAAVLAAAIGLMRWQRAGPDDGDEATHSQVAQTPERAAAGARAVRPELPPGPETLHEARREERVLVASDLAIDGIETDRQWVCRGDAIQMSAQMSARLASGSGGGTFARWLWSGPDGVRLHPGQAIYWDAPDAAGRYRIWFQITKDLGARTVGVLAERAIDVEVRDCSGDQRQDSEPLRLGAVQRGHGRFEFHATYQGSGEVVEMLWNYGDGSVAAGQRIAEHTYDLGDLGPQDTRSYTVRVEARLRDGGRLGASTLVHVGGRPKKEPPPVDLEIGRWRRDARSGNWHTPLTVKNRGDQVIEWIELERMTKRFDDSVAIDNLPWAQAIESAIAIEEALSGGGFVANVVVEASAVGPEVKQIIDRLHGRDSSGQPVVVSWTPFKRTAPSHSAGDMP